MAKKTDEAREQVKEDYFGRIARVVEGGQILQFSETEVRRMIERAVNRVYRGS